MVRQTAYETGGHQVHCEGGVLRALMTGITLINPQVGPGGGGSMVRLISSVDGK